jgi:tetratricopeptide (TPR) repeat protein
MRSASRAWVLCAVATLVNIGSSARADDEAEGKRRFKRGGELYAEGKFLEAAREFEAGFAAAPRPLFLLNIGHSYRRAGEFQMAKDAYEKLLRLDRNTPYRSEVEGLIKTIDDALLSRELDRPAPIATPPPPAPEPVASAPPESMQPPYVVAPPTPTESDSIFKKPWFWVVVGAVAVSAGAAVAVITLRNSACPATVCLTE